MHFDKTHCYDKKELQPQKFAENEVYKQDNELFADFTNILDISEPVPQLDDIFQKSFETHPFSNES